MSWSRAAWATRSTVKPNSSSRSLSGAERRRSASRCSCRVAHVLGPAEGRGLLDRYAGLDVGRQDVVAVRRILVVEELPAGHAHDAGLDAFLRRAFRRRPTQSETSLPVPIRITSGLPSGGVGQDVSPLGQAGGRGVLRAVEGGQVLTREDQHGGLVAQLHDQLARPRRPRWRRRAGSPPGRESRAGTEVARSADGSGRPRRRRSSRA